VWKQALLAAAKIELTYFCPFINVFVISGMTAITILKSVSSKVVKLFIYHSLKKKQDKLWKYENVTGTKYNGMKLNQSCYYWKICCDYQANRKFRDYSKLIQYA